MSAAVPTCAAVGRCTVGPVRPSVGWSGPQDMGVSVAKQMAGKRVVGDVKRKLSDRKVVGRPHLEQSSPPERPASAARHRRARGRRPRG